MARIPDLIVGNITFEEDGSVTIAYTEPPKDMKANRASMNHILFVPAGDDYDDELDEMRQAAEHLVRDVLEDWPALAPMRLRRRHEDETDTNED